MSPVIVDTSVWVQAFRAPSSAEKHEVERLIKAGQAAMMGVVYTEVLRGARDENELQVLEERLDALPFLETTKETWRRAGRLLFDLRRQGLTLPLADTLIAALSLEGGHQVYSLDEHFVRVPGLRLYEGNASGDKI